MVEKLTEQVGNLATTKSGEGNEKFYNSCQKSGLLRQSCFKLKTCKKCKKTGHIAKFCRENTASHTIESLSEISNWRTCSDFVTLPEVNRIILKLKVVEFLYARGFQFTMIPKHIYEKIVHKPALCPIKKSGVGVAQKIFSLDSLAFIT